MREACTKPFILDNALTQEMTYVKQLEEYEEAVMKKRLAEMPEEDVERLMREVSLRACRCKLVCRW